MESNEIKKLAPKLSIESTVSNYRDRMYFMFHESIETIEITVALKDGTFIRINK